MEDKKITIGRGEVNNVKLIKSNYFDLIFSFLIILVVLLFICKSVIWFLIILSLMGSFVSTLFFSNRTRYILHQCDFYTSNLKVCFHYYTFSANRSIECTFDKVEYLRVKLSIFDEKTQVLRIYCTGKRMFFARRGEYPWTEEEFERLLFNLEHHCVDKVLDDSL